MAATGQQILSLAEKHIGERYIFGSLAPKNNGNWKGPWDCAEFTSWLVFQAAGVLYGVSNDHGDPARADAFTGFWGRDAKSLGVGISVDKAARTPGAMVLRDSSDGHIVVSDGRGGTVEAMGARWGVTRGHLANRRWTGGVLIPGVTYKENAGGVAPAPPKVVVFFVTEPLMTGPVVKQIQTALKAAGFDPGPIDGQFGSMTSAAVKSYQLAKRLVPDGEVGPQTARSLGVTLPKV
jgi:putative peptidoglycan binding protein